MLYSPLFKVFGFLRQLHGMGAAFLACMTEPRRCAHDLGGGGGVEVLVLATSLLRQFRFTALSSQPAIRPASSVGGRQAS